MIELEIGTVARCCRGEIICGDEFIIIPGEQTLIALADGLGHGPKANVASAAFCNYVKENAAESLEQILNGATKAISSTRGVAGALVRIDRNQKTLSFAAVGNIELTSESLNPIRPVSLPGIIGRPIRKIKQFDYDLTVGDLVVIFSDGISSRFQLSEYKDLTPKEAAITIEKNHGKHHDDASCIAIRIVKSS